jgi:hypothetical protein
MRQQHEFTEHQLRNELVEWRVHVWLELWGLFELRR